MSTTTSSSNISKAPGSSLFGSLLLAIWFALSSGVWVYWACLFISYPFGIFSLILWLRMRKKYPDDKRLKWIPISLLLGLVWSVSILISLLISD
ncbi:MAG: hypothetical protein GC181_10530 [Bacteroidetes bacterium]|nr:hypothetical protein [Bacteroidota bacterium]